MKSKWLALTFFALVTLAPIILVVYLDHVNLDSQVCVPIDVHQEEALKPLKSDVEYEVKACKVLDGHRFEMYIEGDNWILCQLTSVTKNNANKYVSDIIQKYGNPPPSVVLKRQIDDYWVVNLYLFIDGKKTNIVDVLRDKGLLL